MIIKSITIVSVAILDGEKCMFFFLLSREKKFHTESQKQTPGVDKNTNVYY